MGKNWQDEAAKNQKGGGGSIRYFTIPAPAKGSKTKVKLRIINSPGKTPD